MKLLTQMSFCYRWIQFNKQFNTFCCVAVHSSWFILGIVGFNPIHRQIINEVYKFTIITEMRSFDMSFRSHVT